MLRKREVNNFARLLSCYSKFHKRRFKELHTFRCFSAIHHVWTLTQLAVIPPLLVPAIRHVSATDSKGKGKGLPQEAEVAQGVPGRLRPRIFLTFGTTRVAGRQPYAPAAFTPV